MFGGFLDVRNKTSPKLSRQQVQSIIERVIVFLLSQVVERPPSLGEVSFSLHPHTESCKVLWTDNQAVGFYTVKHKGGVVEGGKTS